MPSWYAQHIAVFIEEAIIRHLQSYFQNCAVSQLWIWIYSNPVLEDREAEPDHVDINRDTASLFHSHQHSHQQHLYLYQSPHSILSNNYCLTFFHQQSSTHRHPASFSIFFPPQKKFSGTPHRSTVRNVWRTILNSKCRNLLNTTRTRSVEDKGHVPMALLPSFQTECWTSLVLSS